MNLYDKARRAEKPADPARLLYKAWWDTLNLFDRVKFNDSTVRRLGGMGIGDVNWGVYLDSDPTHDLNGRPNLQLRWYGRVMFELRANGHFRLIHGLHGSKQRQGIGEHTFLRPVHFRGYNWLVDLDHGNCSWESWYGHNGIKGSVTDQWRAASNPLAPRHYVAERVLGLRGYGWLRPWVKLEHDPFHAHECDSGWHIAYGAPHENADNYDYPLPTQATFDWFENLRIRRFVTLDRTYRQAVGELPWPDSVTATQSAEGLLQQREKFTTAILSGFSVETLARTTPMKPQTQQQQTGQEVLSWELDGSR